MQKEENSSGNASSKMLNYIDTVCLLYYSRHLQQSYSASCNARRAQSPRNAVTHLLYLLFASVLHSWGLSTLKFWLFSKSAVLSQYWKVGGRGRRAGNQLALDKNNKHMNIRFFSKFC